MLAASTLPSSAPSTSGAKGSGSGAVDDAQGAATAKSASLGLIVGCIAGGAVLLGLIGILIYVCVRRRKAEPAPSGFLKHNISKPLPGATLEFPQFKSAAWHDGASYGDDKIGNGFYGQGRGNERQLGGPQGVAAGFTFPHRPASPESAYSGTGSRGAHAIQDGAYPRRY